jgi:hypothetical protein
MNEPNSLEGKQTGDIVSAKKASAQEEYYRYMLLEAKLKNMNGGPNSVKDDLLTVQSEREKIEMDILRNLINITESSPEFSQVVDITGSRDRYEQARLLSEIVYDKVRSERILSFYTPDKASMTNYFDTKTALAYDIRSEGASGAHKLHEADGTTAFRPVSTFTTKAARQKAVRKE